MIEQELLFLGLLVEGPKHGYEIKRQIEEELAQEIGLKIKSIYYPLKKLEETGLIEKETGRQGRWPERNIYCITAKGKHQFHDLIGHSFVSIERPFFQMDLSLYFLPLADKTMAKRRLKVRLNLLKKIVREIALLKEKALNKSKSAFLILQHDLDLVEAEVRSTEKLIQQL